MSDLSNSIKLLAKSLREDQGYFYSWQSNIAMSFLDNFKRNADEYGTNYAIENIHSIANESAMCFLKILMKESELKKPL